ncbi:hypothetical protein [Metabacillus fastidiosus]|uniref:Uncharacterized protein n=1 Tax=Metabacillus fastidiosus TaxID=1458 RepID=A0ABU6NYJ7_9BACI|nr:hypothetical protein [Metabacillus fastidiosus]MED4401349.1 hypothetical protein [Metabacillus fastidiosus]MED4461700.1 hypothetical protein [Metabacillus fastidiosus]
MQLKFSEKIKDNTVNASSFTITAIDTGGFSGTVGATSFSTQRVDGVIDTDVDDEYITLQYNQKVSVSNLSYAQGGSKDVTDLVGNKLANQNVIPAE